MGFMNTTRLSNASSRSIWLAMLSIYFLWGSTYLAIRIAVETIPPFLMAGTRFLIAGIILYGFRRLSGDPAPTRHQWRSAAIIGLFLLLGGNGGITWAETLVASWIAALLAGTVPLWMVLIDAVRPKERQTHNRLHWTTVLGVTIGFA